MKPDIEFSPAALPTRATAGSVALLATAAVVVGILAAFWPTAVSIEAIWRRSETFTHGYVVVPIALWLVWRKRDVLGALSPQPFWPALLLVALGGFGWMTGSLAGVLGLEQFALLVMIEAALVAVLGLRIAREIAFPLVMLVFVVPLGEALVPWLIDRTADFTVAAIKFSGVPVYREGNHLTIPTGRWSVVEACSGLRYLIASILVGALYAHLFYRSTAKRLLFVLVSIVVPIVANWFRAYMIVMLGHLTNNNLATGVDHIIYGWIFFGVVMLVMFTIGARWREDDAVPVARQRSIAPTLALPGTVQAAAVAVVAALALSVIWRPIEAAVEHRSHTGVAALPLVEAPAGWRPAPELRPVWTPHFKGSQTELHQWFERDGRVVGVYVALYAQQSQGRELIASQNHVVAPSDPVWVKMSGGTRDVPWLGATVIARTAQVVGGSVKLTAWAWYWVNDQFTSSDEMAKALLAIAKLSLKPDHSAVIVIYTPSGDAPEQAGETLDAFARDIGQSVMASLRRAGGGSR